MSPAANEVFEQALKLPLEARAALAGTLLDSLDHSTDEAVEEQWRDEIQRRQQALDTGRLATVSWIEARRQILAD